MWLIESTSWSFLGGKSVKLVVYWFHWLVASLNWPACWMKTVKLGTSLDTDIMSHSSWFYPGFSLPCAWNITAKLFWTLNLDLCFAFAGTALKGSGSFSVWKPRLKSSHCAGRWQVALPSSRSPECQSRGHAGLWAEAKKRQGSRGQLHLPCQQKGSSLKWNWWHCLFESV